MEIVLVIFIVVLLICGICTITLADFNSEGFLAFIVTIFVAMIVGAIAVKHTSGPSALDVYRGKTVLQVTYIEAVPIDSVVVYKDKK